MAVNQDSESLNLALTRGLAVLDAFAGHDDEFGVRELGRRLNINPTTVHRLTKTLCSFGYLEPAPKSRRLRLGPKIIQLARVYREQNSLTTIANIVFERYSHRFEHAFFLGVINVFEVAYVAVLGSRAALRVSIEPGGKTTLYSTSMGKLLLASQSDDYIREYLERVPLVSITPNTITSADRLWKQIREIRRKQCAVNRGELHEDIAGVAVPVLDDKGTVVAGMGFGFPLHHLERGKIKLENLIELAREIAQEIRYRYIGETAATPVA